MHKINLPLKMLNIYWKIILNCKLLNGILKIDKILKNWKITILQNKLNF